VEHRRSKPAKAQAWLEKATRWLEQYPKGIPMATDDAQRLHLHHWLEAQVLRRQAKRALALAKRFPAVLRGADKPAEDEQPSPIYWKSPS